MTVFINFELLYIQGLDNCKPRNEHDSSIRTWLFPDLWKGFFQEY